MGEHKFFPEPTFHITLLTVNFSEPSEDIEETKIKIQEKLSQYESQKIYQIENIFNEALICIKTGDNVTPLINFCK